ncbi:MAG: ArsR/SmtB family transcription factor [Solirubrobacteraceae bacterium]
MLADADLAAVAELMSAHRATLLLALIGGRALPASELATRAGISRSLASSHLARLLDGGLVTVEQRGRQRHYRLASRRVAEVIEGMLTIAPARRACGLRESTRGAAIRRARTCYDHLAGSLGVDLTDALQRQRLIEGAENAYRLTPSGHDRLEDLGLDIASLHGRRRTFARPCLDWTERRPHLAGALGAGIAERLLELQWLHRLPGTRAVQITDTGQHELRDQFGLHLAQRSHGATVS